MKILVTQTNPCQTEGRRRQWDLVEWRATNSGLALDNFMIIQKILSFFITREKIVYFSKYIFHIIIFLTLLKFKETNLKTLFIIILD